MDRPLTYMDGETQMNTVLPPHPFWDPPPELGGQGLAWGGEVGDRIDRVQVQGTKIIISCGFSLLLKMKITKPGAAHLAGAAAEHAIGEE